ncbi:MAG TPA: glycoside hydrolase [Chitinophaga sp.]|uniref:glycoside hydrolase n=1 Tax=Chitinophaga sp. TaxID=1869181 RepID=UPI002C8D4C35|nr:glycoside hydrolase [Chitinophaga sp.]HVI44250.1 glycoside hydrolase [Chitinophaga sp.]
MKRSIVFVLWMMLSCTLTAQKKIRITTYPGKTYQQIDNFAASDAWSGQFIGNWPDNMRNAIADLLFSADTLADGSPKGIALSMWRFNIGAGSAEQGDSSGIRDEWRRAASFLQPDGSYNWNRQPGQLWLLKAAQQRGVKQFLGFLNSPPVQYTVNGKAFATGGRSNIDKSRYDTMSQFITAVINGVKQATGIAFDYISPVNEPQWDWSDGGQEGCPYNNEQISGIVKSLSKALQRAHLPTKILIPESGHIRYLLADDDKPGKGNQVNAFFQKGSGTFVGDLPGVSRTIATHSYFSTSPQSSSVAVRSAVAARIQAIDRLTLWQSEYCILGDNNGEINGNKRDTGMQAALYVARVMHTDLTVANVSAWQWWLAVSPYDYKDGLICIDKNKSGGSYQDTKMLWVMGNYSRFVRPGMKRIAAEVDGATDCLVSAYRKPEERQTVIVLVNLGKNTYHYPLTAKKGKAYVTAASRRLQRQQVKDNMVVIEPESVTTIVTED